MTAKTKKLPKGQLTLNWVGKDQKLYTDDDGSYEWMAHTDENAYKYSEVRLLNDVAKVGQTVLVNKQTSRAKDNLLIRGDARIALRSLTELPEFAKEYVGKVKLVYIDPPFNTGNAFAHYQDGVEHSVWLTMMRDRLEQIKTLLTDDGSVWVHLDDNEMHYCKVLMDEVFGRQNYVGTITWQRKYKAGPSKTISHMSDYILIYGKNSDVKLNRLPATDSQRKSYKNRDNDPNGAWRLTHNGKRVYLSDLELKGSVPGSWWSYQDAGHNENALAEIRALFPDNDNPFDTPKPERLLERVIHIGSNPGDIVLDCFAGSGTTAAVAHKMGRRWVTVELSQSNVDAFVLPRLTKVVNGEDPGGVTAAQGWQGGGGFRVLETAPSMYEDYGDGSVGISEWVTTGLLSEAVAAQLGYEYAPFACFAGKMGRVYLAVIDGAFMPSDAQYFVNFLEEYEEDGAGSIAVVAHTYSPEAVDTLKKLRRGSTVRKIPKDLINVQNY